MVSAFNIPVLDYSRILDRADRASLVGWLFGSVIFSTAMAVNIYDGFAVGRFRGALDVALTGSALYCTAKAGKNYLCVYSVGYRNAAQRDLDEAIEETAVAYQCQLADLHIRWQQYVAQLTAQHHAQVDELMSQLSDRLTDIEVMDEQMMHLRSQKFHEQEQARADAEEARESLERDRSAIQQIREELALSEQRLEAREHQMKREAEAIWQEERDRLQQERERLEQQQAQLNAIEAHYRVTALQQAQETVMADIEGYQHTIEVLRDEIASMLRSKPICGNNREALVANKILDALEDMGVYLHRTAYGYDGTDVWVAGYPLPTLNGEKLNPEMALSHIWHELNSSTPLKHIQQAVSALNSPTVSTDDNERLRIDVDLSPVDHKAVEVQQQLAEQYFFPIEDEAALVQFIGAALHINFMAMSGRGKTTLLDNLISLLASTMGPDTVIRYANPKPDRKDHRFPITWIGVRESVYGLFEAAIEIRHRVETNNAIQRQRQTATGAKPAFETWSERLYFIDELNVIVSYFKGKSREQVEAFFDTVPTFLKLDWDRTQTFAAMRTELNVRDVIADLIKFTWRVGRSEKIKLVMAGQNLMPSQLSPSMTKYDAFGQAYICSGEVAIEKAKSEGVISGDIYHELLKAIAAEKDGKIGPFWGVFAPARGSGQPFIAKFPAPATDDSDAASKTALENSDSYSDRGFAPGPRSMFSEPGQLSSENEPEREPNPPNPKPDFGFSENSETAFSLSHSDFNNPILPDENSSDLGGLSNPNPTQTPPDPILDPNISASFYTHVLQAYEKTGTVSMTIEMIWGIKRSRSLEYQVAKWKVRHILNTREIIFERQILSSPSRDQCIVATVSPDFRECSSPLAES